MNDIDELATTSDENCAFELPTEDDDGRLLIERFLRVSRSLLDDISSEWLLPKDLLLPKDKVASGISPSSIISSGGSHCPPTSKCK